MNISIANLKFYKNAIDIKKYKLFKNINNVNYMVYDPDKIIEFDNEADLIIPVNLEKYVNVLKEKLPSVYLQVLYKNLDTIKFSEGLDKSEVIHTIFHIISGNGSTEGYYSPESNEVFLVSKKQKDLFSFLMREKYTSYENIVNNVLSHEIFHMATSTYKDNIQFCGFFQSSKIYDIGNGINEGYTELLARRYFNKEDGYYDDEVIIASLVEEIIGKEIMMDTYFTMDLNRLIRILANYSNDIMAKKFILDMDKYCNNPMDYLLNDILIFIMNIYRNKLIKSHMFTMEEIDIKTSEFNNRIFSYVNNNKNKVL